MSPLVLGIGRAFTRTTGLVHGPTVQIARSPSSLTAANGATGTLTSKVAEDALGVVTGVTTYWHSSDPTVIRIDNAATGAYTVLGTTGQTAVLYADLVAPTGAPSYTGTGGQTAILIDDMSRYAGMTPSAMQTYSSGATNSDRRLYPGQTTTAQCQVVTGLGGTGTALKIGSVNNQSGFTYASGHFRTLPEAGPYTGALQYFSHFVTYDATITQSTPTGGTYDPVGYAVRVKWLEGAHTDGNTRFQFYTTGTRADGSTKITNWGQHDQAFCESTSHGCQVLGPWWDDIANDGLTHQFAYQYRSNTADTGTMNMLIQQADVIFTSSQAGVLAVNQYITLVSGAGVAGWVAPGGSISSAEFQITSFDGATVAHVQRSGTTGHTLTSYSGGVSYLTNVTSTGVFSVSRASSTVASGRPIAIPGTGLVYHIGTFDGMTGCTLTQITTDTHDGAAQQADKIATPYSTILDGISRMWIDGVLIHNISQTGVATTPTGGVNVYCTLSDISTLAIEDGIATLRFGDAQSLGPSYTTTFQNLKWWAVNA